MAFYRGTMFFTFDGIPATAFTESWEYEMPNDDQAAARLNSLASSRRQVLSDDWTITNQRVARLTVDGVGSGARIKQFTIETANCAGSYTGQLGAADSPWAAAIFRINKRRTMEVGPTRPRMYQMRGIPDTWWQGGAFGIPAGDLAKVTTWLKTVTPGIGIGDVVIGTGGELELRPYIAFCPGKVSSRKIGRPFGLYRGRRRCPTT